MFNDMINFIIEIADNKLKEIEEAGYIKAGVNGPYNCVDTPVRNSAHWCVTFSYLYKKTNQDKYKNAVQKLAEYICEIQKNSTSGAIKCMEGSTFTDTNGLIGQAWAIEGLLYSYEIIKDYKYIECSKKIFDSQLFDYNIGEWYQIDTNGENHDFDVAFNHQVWFAAIGYQLNSILNDDEIKEKLSIYESKILTHFDIYNFGLIKHLGQRKKKLPLINRIKKQLKIIYPINIIRKDPDHYSPYAFEAAYQLFNLYGFAIIKKYNPSFTLFRSIKFKKALKYGLNIRKLNKLFNISPKSNEKTCKYAYSYNSPAFEYGYVYKTFAFNDVDYNLIKEIFNIGLNLSYSTDTKNFDRNTNDYNTLTARIYELIRFLEVI